MHPADTGYLRSSVGRSFMSEQLVVLKRKRQIASAGMADDVHAGLVCERRQECGQGSGGIVCTGVSNRRILASHCSAANSKGCAGRRIGGSRIGGLRRPLQHCCGGIPGAGAMFVDDVEVGEQHALLTEIQPEIARQHQKTRADAISQPPAHGPHRQRAVQPGLPPPIGLRALLAEDCPPAGRLSAPVRGAGRPTSSAGNLQSASGKLRQARA